MKNKNTKRKVKKYHWLIILIVTTVITMWVYGNTKIYLPEPIHIGFGQYLDVGTGIVIFSLIFLGIILGILFKSQKKR